MRADDSGGDEVSALAHTFNHMAGELEARTAALDASDTARRQLLADVSHELMTPLTAIRGYTQTLAMPNLTMDEATRGRYFDIVDRETYKLEAIIGDLLDLAKLEGGGSALTIEPVAVDDLFERIAERHDPVLRARNIELVRSVPEDLELDADEQRLEQALQNVASNARAAHARRRPPASCAVNRSATRSASPYATPVRASRPNTCRTSSTASTRPTPRARRPVRPREAASACRSSAPSSNATAAR